MLIEIVLESQGFEGKDQKTNVYKNRARIKVFGRIRMRIAMFIKLGRELFLRIEPEFQCLRWRDDIKIPMIVRIGPKFQWL